MECIVEFLKKNMRYRVVYADRQYFLMDMERSIWPMIFPFLFWLFPQKLYVVDGETIDKVITRHASKNNLGMFGVLGGVGAVLLTPLVKPFLDHTIQSSLLVDIVLITGYVVIVVAFRIYLHNKLQEKIEKKISLESFPTRTIKIRPRYFKQFFLAIVLHLFIIVFGIFSVLFYVQVGHIAGLMMLLLLIPALTISGMFAVHPNFGKNNVYRMKFIDAM